MKRNFDVTDMSCSACSAKVENTVNKLQGVNSVAVSLLTASMSVDFDEKVLTPSQIIEAVTNAGYKTYPEGGAPKKDIAEESRTIKKRLIMSFSLLIVLMYFSMGHMLGIPMITHNAVVLGTAQLVLSVPVLILNKKYFIGGFKALFNKSPNMDSLVAVGASASVVYSLYALFMIYMGHEHFLHDLYFEGAAMIVTLISLGKFFEARSKRKTGDAIEKLVGLAPDSAVVLRDGKETRIPISDVLEGDIVVIKGGESIPVDGTVIDGGGSVDESAITGESIPVYKQAGDSLIGATLVSSGYFKMRADKVGSDTTLSKIIKLVEEAGSSKAPIAKLADKVSGVFVPTVMTIALVTAIIWLIAGETVGTALSFGIAVLVISCPCALGLATPTAIMVATGKGAENGILIKSAQSLETLHSVTAAVLDKTGTVTEGKPKVADIQMDEKYLTYAVSLEALSAHPLSLAISSYGKEKNIAVIEGKDFAAEEGLGIGAVIGGKKVVSGNSRMMEKYGIDISEYVSFAEKSAENGATPLFFAVDGSAAGIISVADPIKSDSKKAVQELRSLGIKTYMLTGDNKRTAAAIAKKADVDSVTAEVLPSQKEETVRSLQEQGEKVLMVGDGINDAPAMTRADVGMAIGNGTDVAIEAADAVLMKNSLRDAIGAIRLSRATIKNIKQNLFWAFFYNILGIPVAAGALYPLFEIKLSPMLAAAAMSFSSVFVVTNALRLRKFKFDK